MALIRCKNCGNLASSRSAACPICGEKINTEPTTTTPNTESTAPATDSTPAPTVESPAATEAPQQSATPAATEASQQSATPAATESPAATELPQQSAKPSQKKTLNDILAERSTTATLNDTHAEEHGEETKQDSSKQSVVVVPTSAPTVNGNGTSNEIYDDDNVRTVEEYEEEIRRRKRTSGGFMIVSIILLICIAILGYLLVDQIKERKSVEKIIEKGLVSNEEIEAVNDLQADILRSNAEELVAELAKYKDQNDTMAMRYEEALQMLAELESDRNHTLDQLRRYQEEVKTLKGIMKQYVRQIDSLHRENRTLLSENTTMKNERKDLELRTEQAEERADELNTKVRQGSVIRASGIAIEPLQENGKTTRRIKQIRRLRVNFELVANDIAEPGEKSVYICITNPEGYTLSSAEMIEFDFEGETMIASAMRKVDYQNNMVPVSIFYDGMDFVEGTYKVDIYIDGRHCGSGEKYID